MSSSWANSRTERGSALLIVFLFAAFVAIMLYREMPVYTFEARRQTEQLLIDRGNEYKHAVKLYYRKVGGYPASVEQLENTNRQRFLRHKYKDPFTGKDDWRLLHMGPGNRLLDSKLNPITNNAKNGTGGGRPGNSSSFDRNSTASSGSTFGSVGNGSSTFGSNMGGFTGLSGSGADSGPQVKVPPLRQRGSAISGGTGGGADVTSALEGNSDISSAMEANSSMDQASSMPPAPESSGTPPTATAPGASGSIGAPVPGQGNAQPGPNTMQLVQGLFNSQAQAPRAQNGSASGFGAMQGAGGLAGVASRASGHSIKTVNDQDDYSLWEFYYDPTKDLQPGLAANGQPNAAAQQRGTPSAGQTVSPSPSSSSQSGTGFHLGTGLGSNSSVPNSPQ